MTWSLDDQELQSSLTLTAAERYEYFVKKVVDCGAVWSLANDSGWVLAADEDGHEAMPVWPHAKYAEFSARSNWVGSEVRTIDLADWLDRWLIGLGLDQLLIAVFPTPAGMGVFVEPERLRADLSAELIRID